jgi:hypothetical protein
MFHNISYANRHSKCPENPGPPRLARPAFRLIQAWQWPDRLAQIDSQELAYSATVRPSNAGSTCGGSFVLSSS